MSQLGGQPPEDSESRDDRKRARPSENSSIEPAKKKRKLIAEQKDEQVSSSIEAIFAHATAQEVSIPFEVKDHEMKEQAPRAYINKPKAETPPEEPETPRMEDITREDFELLPIIPGESVQQVTVNLPKEWGLDAVYCTINGEKVYFTEILRQNAIRPVNSPLVAMDLEKLPWGSKRASELVTAVCKKFMQFITSSDEDKKQFWSEIEAEIVKAKGLGLSADFINTFLPDLVCATSSWRTAIIAARALTRDSSEQDFTAQCLTQYFEPFLLGLSHKACCDMRLPPSYKNMKRKPDTCAFVGSDLGEFIFFIREDSPVRKGKDRDLHKDLQNIVQLMRCALRLQTLMLGQNYNGKRTLYCFGILCNGSKFQLLQMSVELEIAEDYVSPKFDLFIDTDLLDLGFGEETSNEEIHSRLTRLFNWLSVIRGYGFYLKNQLRDNWQLRETMLVCQTTAKVQVASSQVKSKSSSSKQKVQDNHGREKNTMKKEEDDDDDDHDGTSGDRDVSGIKRILDFSEAGQNKTNNDKSAKDKDADEVNEPILTAIVDAIECKRYTVIDESHSSDKKVVAVCTFTGRINVYAVKIFGVMSQKVQREVEVMKYLGKHPHISEVLATATLKGGELILVQPYYSRCRAHILHYFSDYCKIFLHLAMGLEHMHKRGVIHGDIKPSNLIYDSTCFTRIIDFDFSLRIGIDGWNEFVGTSGYRAPEVKTKQYELTPKVDIWSLAMTMCASLAGFDEEEDSLKKRQIMLTYLKSDNFFGPLRLLLAKMISMDPETRPTARQVRECIELSMEGKDYVHILDPCRAVPVREIDARSDNKENRVVATGSVAKSPKKHRAIRPSPVASPLKDITNLAK